jgi:gliding motility-associated-like protein
MLLMPLLNLYRSLIFSGTQRGVYLIKHRLVIRYFVLLALSCLLYKQVGATSLPGKVPVDTIKTPGINNKPLNLAFRAPVGTPGGITTGMKLWLKADDGVLSGDGVKVSKWTNVMATGYDVATTTVADQPLYYSQTAANLLNFNPSLSYPGTQAPGTVLRNTARLFPNTSGFQVVSVAMDRRPNTATAAAMLSLGVGGNNPSLLLSTGVAGGWALFMSLSTPQTWVGSNAILYNGSNSAYPNKQPQLFSVGSDNLSTSAVDNIVNWIDGYRENTNMDANQQIDIGNGVFVGSSDDNAPWNGLLPEAIIYDRKLTDAEMVKLNTYLAIKYGITLDQRVATNYVATNNAVIWNATTNVGYKNNIAGIGRDDAENLLQKQSRSVNIGTQVAIGLGSLATTNADNAGSFPNDQSYLIWGDNNGALTFQTTVPSQTFVNYRMARIWKVQQTAAFTNQVQMAIPLSALPNLKLPYVIISNDNIFDGTDQFVPLSEITLQGVKHYAATVSFTSGQYFTFGANIKSPGGVLGTTLWMRPDFGTATADNTAITTWTEYVAGQNNATQTVVASRPVYVNNTVDNVNFNPQMKFNGSQMMNLDVTKLPLLKTPRTLFGIGKPSSITAPNKYIISWGSGGVSAVNGLANVGGVGDYVGYADDVTSAGFWQINVPNQITGTWVGNGGIATLYGRGKQLGALAKPAWNTGNAAAKIGAIVDDSERWMGTIGDVIVYPVVLSNTDRRKVETYLAIKYGHTLDTLDASKPGATGSYLATNGSIIWSNNDTYKYNIAGIGFDDIEGLEQKQSRSIHAGSILTIGLGTIATTNLANASTFDVDRSYMLWGSNSNVLTTINTNLPVGSCILQRLTQQWKVQYSNFDVATKQLALEFDLTGITYAGTAINDFTLLIDTDGDGNFATGTINIIPATAYDAAKKKVSFSGVKNIPAGAVFTITTNNPVRKAILVADGQSKTAAPICREGDWIYFIDPTDNTKYIAAIDLNGNSATMADFSAAMVDVNRNMTALGANSGTDYGTQLMRRLLQIKYTGAPLMVNGGVKLRYLWNPTEKDNAATYLSATRNITAAQKWTWFRHDGDIATTLTDLTPEKLKNITSLTPAANGLVDGVPYVEFENVQNFGVWGGVLTANEVLAIRKVQDGEEGVQDGQFSIELPENIVAPEDILVKYTIAGTAVNGGDYTTLSGQITLLSGENKVVVPVLVIDDEVIELTETVQLQLTSATGITTTNTYNINNTQKQATMNIVDNDQGKVILGVTKITDAAEPTTNGSFSISLPVNVTSSEAITVSYGMSGTATNGTDYTNLSGVAIIPAGQTSISLPVNVIDDYVIEGTEIATLTVTGGTSANFNFTVVAAAANMNIADDDDILANKKISITRLSNAAEPSTGGAFQISLPPNITAAQDLMISFAVSGSASNGTDYNTLSGPIKLTAGQNKVLLGVVVKDDKIIEGDENVDVTVTGGTTTGLGNFSADDINFSATVTIADDDNIAINKVLRITKTADAAEPTTNGGYSFSLPSGISVAEAVTVNYVITGTATNGTDYTLLSGSVLLPAGQTSVPLPVAIIDDNIIEGDESVIATLKDGSSTSFAFTASATAKEATVTISDDDNIAANKILSIVKVKDAAEPNVNGEFEIKLPGNVTAADAITVNYTVTGTATNGTDYTTLSGTVVIPAGQHSVILPVQVKDDKIIEGNETVIVTLKDASSTAFGAMDISTTNKTATGTIADDDNIPANLVVNVTKDADAAEPATHGGFTFSLPNGITVSEDVTINYTIGGNAGNGIDYNTITNKVIIPAGQNSVKLPIIVKDDKIIEGDETVSVTLSTMASASFTLGFGASKTATVTIADDDNTAVNKVISAVKIKDAAEPATNGSFSLQLPVGVTTTEVITVNYTLSGTATNGTDYALLSGVALIPAGQNGVNIPVNVIDDNIIEDDESIIITVTGGTSPVFGNYTSDGTPATVIIADDDNIAANKILSITKTTDAAEPATNGGFMISLPTGITMPQDITVSYTVGGTATNGTDYNTLSGSIVIPAGQQSVALPVIVKDDKIIEINESVIVTISGGTSASYGVFVASSTNGTATVSIADDDHTPANSVLSISKTTDAAEPATNGAFRISLPAGVTSSQDITVKYTVAGTATPVDDYAKLLGTLTIPAGQNSVSLPVMVVDDQIIEVAETVIVTLNGGTSTSFVFTGTSSATVTIADNDHIAANKILRIQKELDAAEPADNGAFRISLPGGITASENITINYTVAGTATPGVDYTNLSGSVVLLAGQNSVLLSVDVIDDLILEGDETVEVTLLGGITTNLGAFTASTTNKLATVIITDNDNTADNKKLSIAKTADAAEPGTNGEFKISLPAGITVAEAVTVKYTISGTATNGVDYNTLSGSAVIAAGQNSINIPLMVIDDQIAEGNESVILTLTGGTSTHYTFTVNATAATAAATIADDDDNTANKILSIVKTTDAAEPGTNGTYTISLPNGITWSRDITVQYTVAGTATNGTDYTTLNGIVVLLAGQNSTTLTVAVLDDKIIEGNETVIAALTGGTAVGFGNFTASTVNGTATMTIADDDNIAANKLVSIVKASDAAEPATNGGFTISLPKDVTVAEDVTVNYAITGTAGNGTDYNILTGIVVIHAGQNSVPLAVVVKDDKIIENSETVIATLGGSITANFGVFNADAVKGIATVTIADDDNTAINKILSAVKTGDAAEPGTNGGFSISLPTDITVAESVTVSYSLTGTATNGVDYANLNGTVILPAGQNSVSIPVTVIDDKIIEGTETVVLGINGGTSTSFGFTTNGVSASLNILDDDNTAGNKTLRITKVTDAAEPGTNGSFRIILPTGITAASDLQVSYLIDGSSTAIAGTDYNAITGNIIIPAGQNSVVVPVLIIDDQIIEPVEKVVMKISGGTDALFTYSADAASNTATVFITDDDFTNNSNVVLVTKVSDAIEGGVHGQFKIALPIGVTAAEDVTVHYEMGGSATNAADYTSLGGTAVIPAGANYVLVYVAAYDDGIIEGPEQAVMSLTGASSATYTFNVSPGSGSATVNIIDANAAESTSIVVTKILDAAEPNTKGKFHIALSGGAVSNFPVTVGYSLSGTAATDVDYNIAGTIVIPANENFVDVDVAVIDDKIIEAPETVILTIISGSATDGAGNAFIFPADIDNTATVTITDDDNTNANRVLSVVQVADATEPGTNGSYKISLPTDYTASTDITVTYAITGSATINEDYTISPTATIPHGQNYVIVPVKVIDDKIIELTEEVILTLTAGTDILGNPYTPAAAAAATVKIMDDDGTSANRQITITRVADGSEPAVKGQFKISLPANITSSEDIVVSYAVDGTATNGTDYTTLTNTITLPAGQNSVLLDVLVIDDKIIEGNETVIVTLAGGASASFTFAGTNSASLVIGDDDNTNAIRVLEVQQITDATEPNTPGRFRVSLPPNYSSARDIVLQYTLTGTATREEDYTVTTVILPANANSVDIPVTVIDDMIIEPTETVILELTGGTDNNGNNYAANSTKHTATVNIADDDNTVVNKSLKVTKLWDAAEPTTSGAFSISLPAGVTVAEDVTITYTMTGAALNGTDYNHLTGTVVLPAGSNSVKVIIVPIDDRIIEGDETVILTVTGGSSVQFAAFNVPALTNAATLILADDDNTTGNKVIGISKAADASEPNTHGGFNIGLPAGVTAAEDITVNYTIAGTAENGVDYAGLTGTVIIPHDQNSVPVSVTVIDDKIIELPETVVLSITDGLSASFNFTADLAAASDIVTIADDDNIASNKVLRVVKTADAVEPGTNGAFSITLPPGVTTSEDIKVNYTITGSADNGTDYTIITSTIIPAGNNSVLVPVNVIDDLIIEGDETVILTLTGGVSTNYGVFTVNSTNDHATVTIGDDDNTTANKTLQITKITDAAEPANNGSFKISLPVGVTAKEGIAVKYSYAGTATNGVDYENLSGTVVIPAGHNSIDLPLIVKDDKIIEGDETVIITLTEGTATNFTFDVSTTAGSATLTIADDENTTTNRVISITKGNDAAEPAINGAFVVSLPAGLTAGADVTVHYTVGGTATSGTDYVTLSGTVVIPKGQQSVFVPVQVMDDLILEETETVSATFIDATALGIGNFTASSSQGSGLVSIIDNDNTTANKVLQVTKTTDAAEPATNGAFTISLPTGVTVSNDILVHYTLTGTALNGTDYTIPATTIIPAGQHSVAVPVTVIDDKIIEGDETVKLTLTNGVSATFGNFAASSTVGDATVTITDDDDNATNRALSIVKTTDAAEPATNGAFTISLPAGITASAAIKVDYVITGTALNGTDYTISNSATIPAGQEKISVPVTVIDDKIIEGDETVILTITGGTTTTIGNFNINNSNKTATLTITDDDDVTSNLVLSIIATKPVAAEPATNGEVTITLPTGITSATNITVEYTIGGTGVAGTDYKILSGTVVLPAGANSINIPVEVIDNQVEDGTRTVLFTLKDSHAGSRTLVPGTYKTATVDITDNDVQRFDTWKTVALPAGNTSGKVLPNQELTYTIYVRNTGTIPISQLTITDPVPANTIYVSGGTITGNTVTFNMTNVAAGATASVTMIVKTPASLAGVTSITNTAQVTDGKDTKSTGSCDPTLPGCNAQTGTIIEASDVSGDLVISKEVLSPLTGPYRMGQDVTYSIKVKNLGNTEYTNVIMEDALPLNLDMPKSVSVLVGQVNKDANSRKVTWNIGQLQGGAEVELTMICRIIEGSEVVNRATVTAQEPEVDMTNNTAVATIEAGGDDLTFQNVFTPNGDSKNERFIIGGLEKYPGSAIYIYNRWGSMVYQSKDYRNDWNGSGLSAATYYYVLEVRKPQGTKHYKGWVQILR